MKNVFSIVIGAVLCAVLSYPVFADELKVNINVENGAKPTQVIGADIYALVDGKLTEITIAPDDMPFRSNNKFGALRLKSFWLTKKKAGVVENN